jgi:hypothetical protein
MTAMFNAGREEGHVRAWLSELVFAFDGILRQRQQVFEFTSDPACIFRAQLARAERAFDLADGTRVRPGGRMLNLHYWNEQIPRVPPAGATIGWARQFRRQMELSLCELGRYCAQTPELFDIVAIAANVAQGTREQRDQLTNIMRRFGFAPPVAIEPTRSDARLRRLGENVLITVFILARNPMVLRADTLWRDRTELFLSRTALAERFGRPRRSADSSPQIESRWRTP